MNSLRNYWTISLQRAIAVEQTATRRGFHPAIAEKDFWVCWSLMKLFDSNELRGKLVFKGGTSLSKAHHLIERFSEDIDLVLNWELLGYGKNGNDPWQNLSSNTKLDKFNVEFNERASVYIFRTLLPIVKNSLASCPDVRAEVSPNDPHVIAIHYPAAFSLNSLRPEVKLEIGPLASWVPSGQFAVRSFAADEFPTLFDRPECTVTAITAERTFWEKATILHQQAFRTTDMLPGYSRHYYDLYQLSRSVVANNALADLQLLADVVEFKQRFYRSKWANYELANPGTFRLLPTPDGNRTLRSDYRMMEPMFFKSPPPWDDIVSELALLEKRINQLKDRSESGE